MVTAMPTQITRRRFFESSPSPRAFILVNSAFSLGKGFHAALRRASEIMRITNHMPNAFAGNHTTKPVATFVETHGPGTFIDCRKSIIAC